MPEKESSLRPTKKQRELLNFISDFIASHGYSPSYREIMNGLNYNSVATVALHVNSLIKRGHLQKRDRSARSLEVVGDRHLEPLLTNAVTPVEEKWLVEKVEHMCRELERSSTPTRTDLDNLIILIGAMKILGLEGAAQSFSPRINRIRQHFKT